MTDRNDFTENGMIRVRFETPAERAEIIRILEERAGIRVGDGLKRMTGIRPNDTRTFDINLKAKRFTCGVEPFAGAAMCSAGVRFYTAEEFARIAALGFRRVPRYVLFHVPHDGCGFPADLLKAVCVPEEVFLGCHERMRDLKIGEAVPTGCRTQTMCCSFEVSRLLCDVERLIGPEEIMERYGMGFCYEKAYDGRVIKRVTEEAKAAARILYDAHHRRMNAICGENRRVLLFDLHSYTDEILPPFVRGPGAVSPDLCIGTDPRFTPPRLTATVRRRFEALGFTTAENKPYTGLYVPETVSDGKARCDFAGVMLEFNRRAYCDSAGRPDPERLARIRGVISRIMADCVDLP